MDYSLYYVADVSKVSPGKFLDVLEDALRGGVSMVQLRAKELTWPEFLNLAAKVKKLCRKYGVPFIVNDRIDIALASNADGVHLGDSDTSVSVARKVLGKRSIIGRTVRSADEAVRAEYEGASYVSVGSIYPTKTKRVPKIVGPSGIGRVRQKVKIPVVAIGGIGLKNARTVIRSGADGIAVVSAIAHARNPFNAASKLRKLIK
ncbi:MAG: thiamine phosphate synthase [Candidatus Eisenbacteria bacterium]|nr:thiamine phosphate synthase [Candidatus Eisenbacteria bacterium]